MMYPIGHLECCADTPADFVRLLAITVASGLFAVPVMIEVGKGMLKMHELVPLRNLVISVSVIYNFSLDFYRLDWGRDFSHWNNDRTYGA